MKEKEFYSPKQVAKIKNLSYMQVMRLIRGNKIKAHKIDWNWAIPASEIDKIGATNEAN